MIAEETTGTSELGIHTGFRSAVAYQRKQHPSHQRQKVSMANREDSNPALGKSYGAPNSPAIPPGLVCPRPL